jgi:F-type H+-transporting ATPase subunit epsilon
MADNDLSRDVLEIEIISPRRVIFRGSSDYLEVMTPWGKMGVYPLHAAIISLLEPGDIICRTGGSQQTFAASRGILDCARNRVLILVEEAEQTPPLH